MTVAYDKSPIADAAAYERELIAKGFIIEVARFDMDEWLKHYARKVAPGALVFLHIEEMKKVLTRANSVSVMRWFNHHVDTAEYWAREGDWDYAERVLREDAYRGPDADGIAVKWEPLPDWYKRVRLASRGAVLR